MARFRIGDQVGVLATVVDTHHRTPDYVKGKTGRITARCGIFPDPELKAYGGSGRPDRTLYRIEFKMRELWGERYKGPQGDTLLIDIYENWLSSIEWADMAQEAQS